jgi:phage-related protein (TIGR01555 family)
MRDALAIRDDKAKVTNSFEGLIQGLSTGLFPGGNSLGPTISQAWTFLDNATTAPITLNRTALNYGYMRYGVVRTIVRQPIDDAFKGGLIIKSDEMDDTDYKALQKAMRQNRDIKIIKDALIWSRNFGGAGLIIVTDQEPREPLDKEAIGENDVLKFVAADRWELTVPMIDPAGYAIPTHYLYYGESLDWSRVIRVQGTEAPSFIRKLLQGWGMSELESCLRDLNSYLKLQTVIFELVDEAKVDVYKLQELNNMLGNANGTAAVTMRIQFANLIKNYKNALVLDKEDEFEQKQIVYSGLADILEQGRINLAGSTRIPVAKLFGLSASGFASGEDALENYNALVESEIREVHEAVIEECVSLRMQQVFGAVPDFELSFHPLRIASPLEEEQIKTSKQARVMALRMADQISGQEADEILHKEELLDIDTEVGAGLREPMPAGQDEELQGEKKPASTENSRADMQKKWNWLKGEAKRAFNDARRKAA